VKRQVIQQETQPAFFYIVPENDGGEHEPANVQSLQSESQVLQEDL